MKLERAKPNPLLTLRIKVTSQGQNATDNRAREAHVRLGLLKLVKAQTSLIGKISKDNNIIT